MKGSKRLILKYFIDLTGWLLATPLAFWIRLEDPWLNYVKEMLALLWVGFLVKGIVLYFLGYHRRSWHKVGIRDLFVLIEGVSIVTLFLLAFVYLVPNDLNVPRSVPLIEGMLAILVLGFTRLVVRLSHESLRHPTRVKRTPGEIKNVLIVGAGEAGTMIAREMLRHPEAGMRPAGFIDDNPSKRRQRFLGLRVWGSVDDLPRVIRELAIDEVLIAMPSQTGDVVRRVVMLAREAKVKHRTIPGIYELLSGQVSISQIREVDVEDLLRRAPVRLDESDIEEYVTGRVVLVTGAGGSIGSEIVRQVARFSPEQIVLLGRGENSIYEIMQEGKEAWPDVLCTPVIADVRDRQKVAYVFDRFRPHLVFHAAAHKHVPLMEANPDEAVLNNVCGTRNLVEMALRYRVERFVNVSTDKAVNPTSIMGASKRVAEYVVEWGGRRATAGQQFVSVRFGNVLGSRGSVIPLFKKQVKRGGPVTVTHEEMVRYFMTIPEAAQLVLQAGGLGGNGRVYVLDMGEPVRIVDLARDLIMLSGFEPGVDIPIQVTGIRPGEKLFEELLTAEEGTIASRHEKIFVARKNGLPEDEFEGLLDALVTAATERDVEGVRQAFKAIIPSHMLDGEPQVLATQEEPEVA